ILSACFLPFPPFPSFPTRRSSDLDNPTLPIRQQQNGGFNFQQQIQMAVNGSLGQKMKIAANFDSNNSFDFQNQLKVEYDGFDERSEEHTSEIQSRENLVCRLLLEQ